MWMSIDQRNAQGADDTNGNGHGRTASVDPDR
jgi:hypothetical protein